MLDTQNPLILTDVYKSGHMKMTPPGVMRIYSTYTARGSRIPGVDYSIFMGLADYLKGLQRRWAPFFANKELAGQWVQEYAATMKGILGIEVPTAPFYDLWKARRLPITIRSVKEGTRVPLRTPSFVMESTDPALYWLPQFLETDISNRIWKAINSATLSTERRKRDRKAIEISGGPMEMLDYLNHDFSYRGMSGLEDAIMSGIGHLVGSNGTDTIPAVVRVNELYKHADWVGRSVPATEHSTMEIDGEGLEFETFKRLLSQYPGPISVVSDTWNLWRVVQQYLPRLGKDLTDRKAPLIIRPDSGDPVKILTGDPTGSEPAERLGLVPYLLEIHEHNVRYTTQGYRLLPQYLGTVYGDSMNPERCDLLNKQLLNQGICPTNTVRGIGSFTYEYQTRDSLGQAVKATQANVRGEERDIFKKPVTDSGEKHSNIGRVGLILGEDGSILGSRDRLRAGDPDNYPWTPMVDGAFHYGPMDFDLIRKETGEW